VNGTTAGNLTVVGGGTLFLSNAFGAASTFTQELVVVSGIVNASNQNALANVVLVAGTGAAVQLQGPAVGTISAVFYLTSIGVGIVVVAATAATRPLGSLAGTTTVAAGASLQFNAAGPFNLGNLILNGNGVPGALFTGALFATANTTFNGNITLNPGATL